MTHNDSWAEAVRQHDEKQRQQRLAREQAQSEALFRKKQQEQELSTGREQQRRDAEQRIAEQHQIEQQRRDEKQRRNNASRNVMLGQSAESLQSANKQRDEVLREAHQRMKEIRARRPDVPCFGAVRAVVSISKKCAKTT